MSRTAWPTRWCSSAIVSPPGNVMACGSDSQSGMPWSSMNSSNVSPSQSGPGSCSPQRSSMWTSTPPSAGASSWAVSIARGYSLEHRTTSPSSPVSARRVPRRSHWRRPRSDSPAHVRGPPIERFTLAIDSPWRTSTSRVGGSSSDSIACHRTDRTFRSESRPRRARPRRVGAVAPGPRPIHRFTVRSRDADPRADAIAAGASSLGIALDGAVDVADLVFVEGELDDGDRHRLGAFLADPLLQTGLVGRPHRAASRSRCTPV